jgi:hypothetical protein
MLLYTNQFVFLPSSLPRGNKEEGDSGSDQEDTKKRQEEAGTVNGDSNDIKTSVKKKRCEGKSQKSNGNIEGIA